MSAPGDPDVVSAPVGRRVLVLGAQAGLVSLAVMTCALAPWLAPRAAGALLRTARGEPSDGDRSDERAAGWLWLVLGGALAVVSAAAGAVLSAEWNAAAGIMGGIVLPAIVAIGCAPWMFAPFARLDGARGIDAACGRAVELARRRGGRAVQGDASVLGGVIGATVQLASLEVDVLPVVVSIPLRVVGASAGLAAATGWLGSRYGLAARRAGSWVDSELPVSSGARRAARVVLTIGALLLGAAAAVAVVTPAPMRELVSPQGNDVAAARPEIAGRPLVAVPGPHGLQVRRVANGVSIETADGGGAGFVALPGGRDASAELAVERASFRGRDGYAVRTSDGRFAVYVDEQGVRLDDTPGDRLRGRSDRAAWALLLAAFAGVVTSTGRLRDGSALASTLGAVAVAAGLIAAALCIALGW